VGADELKGGSEHPRKNRVWKKIYVCYVETSDVFPEARQLPSSLFHSLTCTRQANRLRRFAKLSLGTRSTSSFQCVSKTLSIAVGGKESLVVQFPVSQNYLLIWASAEVCPTCFFCNFFIFQSVELPVRPRASFCSAKSPPRLAHPDGYSVYSINTDEVVIIIHSLFNRCFSSCPGHISHVFVNIPHLFDISRRWLCRTAGNTRRMGSTCCATYA
jgi:hypothetical protein